MDAGLLDDGAGGVREWWRTGKPAHPKGPRSEGPGCWGDDAEGNFALKRFETL